MHTYTARAFTIPPLEGISQKSVEEHLGLYQGYVKNFMGLCAQLASLMGDSVANSHALSEVQRRLSFEFDGMRLHEYYFEQFEAGAHDANPESAFAKAVSAQWNGMNIAQLMKNVGLMRGPGWAILYYDPKAGVLHPAFIGEQHQGHFATLPIILALDVWEHAYLVDHGAQGKGAYIDAFFKNLNWSVVEERFEKVRA